MQGLLEDAGYNVLTTRDLVSARRWIARVSIDLVILDWRLGPNSGGDLLDALPKCDGLAVPATLVTTGSKPGGTDHQGALARGAANVMFKPCSRESLRSHVAACLRYLATRRAH